MNQRIKYMGLFVFLIAVIVLVPKYAHAAQQKTNDAYAHPPTQSASYLLTDKLYYQVPLFGYAIVKIHGNIAVEYGSVSITIETPFNKYTTVVAHTNSTGSFFVPYVIKFDAPAGMYVVTANYEGKEITTTFLVVRL